MGGSPLIGMDTQSGRLDWGEIDESEHMSTVSQDIYILTAILIIIFFVIFFRTIIAIIIIVLV